MRPRPALRRPCRVLAAVLLASLAAAAGCGDDDGDGDAAALEVLSLNMYIGLGEDILEADLSDPAQYQAALQQALANFQQTDAPARIRAMARFIAEEQPHVVGLQEVISLALTRGTPSPDDDGTLTNFLEELLDGIEAAGGPRYQSFRGVNNRLEGSIDLLGRIEPFLFEEADVLLVHPDLPAQQVGSLLYSELLPAGNSGRVFVRGLVHVRATRGAQSFELVNTHLEVRGAGGVGEPYQLAQAMELVDYVERNAAQGATAVLLTGDMNGVPGSATYEVLTQAAFEDTFAEAGSGSAQTCCQAPLLDNAQNSASERIDYVFCRDGAAECSALQSEVVLDARVARTSGSGQIWPSDHFGVLSVLEFP